MGIRILGIAASPRRSANSEYLLEQALEAAVSAAPDLVEAQLHSIGGKRYQGCVSCFGCLKTKGLCVRKDDFQELREMWEAADVILYSIPVYHMGIPGQLKCFLDRLGNAIACKYMPEVPKQLKVVGCIAQGAHWFSGQENAIMQIMNHALMMGCVPISGDMPECYIGAGGTTANDIGKNALKSMAAVGDSNAIMVTRAAQSLAKRAVELSILLRSGAVACRERFGPDAAYAPLYDRISSSEAR